MEQTQELFDKILAKVLNDNNPGDSDRHLMTLFSLVLQIRAKNILELGVRWGDTTEPLVLGTYLVGGKVTSVDVAPTQWICPVELRYNYQFIQCEAIEFLKTKADTYYDIVYIDDWHSYEHVKEELQLVEKMTDCNSLILLHDLMGQGNNPNYFLPIHWHGEWENGGPYRAVKELDPTIWEWSTIPVNHGFTILRKKSGREIS
jgi:hypothetical protein